MSRKKKKKPVEIALPSEVKEWALFAFACIMLISLLSFAYGNGSNHWLGLLGYTIGWVQAALFGLSSYFLAIYLGWFALRRALHKPINNAPLKHACLAVLMLSTSMLLTVLEERSPEISDYLDSIFYAQQWSRKLRFHLGGAFALFLYRDFPFFNMERILNWIGVTIIFSATWITSFIYLFKVSPKNFMNTLMEKKPQIPVAENIMRQVQVRIPSFKNEEPETIEIAPEREPRYRPSFSKKVNTPEPFELKRKEPKEENSKRQAALNAQSVYNGDFTNFQIPSANLLTNPKKVDQSSLKKDLKKQAEVLEETLMSFGIEAKVGQINCGPTITSFEVHPAIGVKVQKVKALENDIALNMEAKSIPILAPIPGKAAIGIEVPNPQPQEVAFKDMLIAYLNGEKKFHIPVLLGKTVSGDYVLEDLAKMPHVIIAGATGSGKSVCINTIVMSILMTAKPDEIKMIMVDPKKVELTPYTKLPHMLAPVITEPQGACAALAWLVKEMENRYEILKQVGQRNIDAFNKREMNKEFEESLGVEVPAKMHYIVCIIDELADLMMVASNDMETHIARIAQMARAVGIHLILATQRPSREVITGLIKANFPTRISFKVSSRINSQIILDEPGAEMLLGNGDLLFLPPGIHHLIRAQGAFIRDSDINAVIEKICAQAPTNYVIESFDNMEGFATSEGVASDEPKDTLYEQAYDIVVSTGNASTTFLQRKLKVGYARAASIMDQLERDRVVSPQEGAKARKVLVRSEDPDEMLI